MALTITVACLCILLLGYLIVKSGACDIEATDDSWDTRSAFPEGEGFRDNMKRVKQIFTP